MVVSISAMLIAASLYKGGLSDFFVNTSQDYALLASTSSGFIVSGVVCIGVSLCTNEIRSDDDVEKEWAKTINIDNPINPFRLLYTEELSKLGAGPVITAKTMSKIFRKTWIYAIVGGLSGISLFLIVIPTITLSIEVLSLNQFSVWLRGFQIACFVFTVIAVVVPPVEEGYVIWKQYNKNKEISVVKCEKNLSGTRM